MASASLEGTAVALVAPGRGILAADESHATIGRRFDALGIANSEETRRRYRQLLFTTKGIGDFISGVILFDETIRQTADDGRSFTEVLASVGVIAGIKVDRGSKPLAGAPGEQVTEGLDELRERLAEYKTLGARFAKWRAVITLGEDGRTPTRRGLEANSHALARYAALIQEAGIVPIVEPEVLMDGDHSIDRCYEVSVRALRTVFNQLASQRVDFDGMLLKPAMVLSGKEARDRAPAETVARYTLHCFLSSVPAMVPGIVFLSGGQSDDEATVNLDAINRRAAELGGVPWQLTFSYGRGLQAAPQKAWSGKRENVAAAQRAFVHRSR